MLPRTFVEPGGPDPAAGTYVFGPGARRSDGGVPSALLHNGTRTPVAIEDAAARHASTDVHGCQQGTSTLELYISSSLAKLSNKVFQ